jgi:prevent-host-death family protein
MSTEDRRVGIRELRQHLTVYLRRVKTGEVLEVTDRGRPVALLTPLPERGSALERLVASGRALPARTPLAELDAPPALETEPSISDALDQQRGDR